MFGFVVILFQLFIYHFFLRRVITTWGASKEEASMPMEGDKVSQVIKSTRAISISDNKSNVWRWLIQLGADRCGFYSYTFIEKALGYKTRRQEHIYPEFKDIKVGDVVRGSIDEKSSIIPYNFPVLDVKPEKALILENWGTFSLRKITDQETRLIVRTRENRTCSIYIKLFSYIMVALHFIMERRTLLGIKECIETRGRNNISQCSDVLWFLGIIFSEVMIFIIAFSARGVINSLIVPLLLSLLWLFSLFLFKPIPIYSIGVLAIYVIFYLL